MKFERGTICGFGINDIPELTFYKTEEGKTELIQAYKTWTGIIDRCYRPGHEVKFKAYADCSVCKEWKYFSNFKKWFDENYIEGFDIDKDILIKGNKVYSPEACCFVPRVINLIFAKNKTRKSNLPRGVKYKKYGNRYSAEISIDNKNKLIGYFKDVDSAAEAYNQARKEYISEIADRYKNVLKPEVSKALKELTLD